MTISPASGVPTAGQPYSLICSVQTVPGLVVEPSIVWTRGDGSVIDTSSSMLNFNPLRASDGDRYTCSASVNIPKSTPVSGQAFTDLIVTSKLLCSMFVATIYNCDVSFPSVPQPTVVIMRSRSGTVYAGTQFTLTSDISFSDESGVDVDISLDISWTRDSAVIASDGRTTVSGVSGSGTSYTASLSFSPIATSDSGQFTATVTVRPATTSQYIQSVTATGNTEIVIVEGT